MPLEWGAAHGRCGADAGAPPAGTATDGGSAHEACQSDTDGGSRGGGVQPYASASARAGDADHRPYASGGAARGGRADAEPPPSVGRNPATQTLGGARGDSAAGEPYRPSAARGGAASEEPECADGARGGGAGDEPWRTDGAAGGAGGGKA